MVFCAEGFEAAGAGLDIARAQYATLVPPVQQPPARRTCTGRPIADRSPPANA
jgi:hypothetical protein